jgi:hypothetical protein
MSKKATLHSNGVATANSRAVARKFLFSAQVVRVAFVDWIGRASPGVHES